MNDTITFEIKNVEWAGMFEGKTTAHCTVNVPYDKVARCTTDQQVAELALKTLEAFMGCPIKVCDSIQVAA